METESRVDETGSTETVTETLVEAKCVVSNVHTYRDEYLFNMSTANQEIALIVCLAIGLILLGIALGCLFCLLCKRTYKYNLVKENDLKLNDHNDLWL